jgi:RIO-like serine/threonine protein kinase
MTPFEKRVINCLKELNRTYGPVVSYLLAIALGMNERTCRFWLKRLEYAGMVRRPRGKRKGYVVA